MNTPAPAKNRQYRFLDFTRHREFGSNVTLFLMSLPALLHIVLFGYVTLPWLLVAFKEYRNADGLWGSKWIGWDNFQFLFSSGQKGWVVTRNTVGYNAVFIIVGTILALLIAILLSEIIRSIWARFFQTALFLPNFFSWVVAAYAGFAFLDTQTGMINGILNGLGHDSVRWYRSPVYWPFILVTANIWKGLGITSLIYLAGILGIDPEILESAQLDGAKWRQQVRYITLPLLRPLIIVLTLLAIGRIMYADFGLFYQMPRTYLNPQLIGSTDVFDTFVYRSLVGLGQLEMATAAGLFQAVVGLILILVVNGVIRKIDRERALF